MVTGVLSGEIAVISQFSFFDLIHGDNNSQVSLTKRNVDPVEILNPGSPAPSSGTKVPKKKYSHS